MFNNLKCVKKFHEEKFFDINKMNVNLILKPIKNQEDNVSIIKKEF